MNNNSENIKNNKDEEVMDNSIKSITKKLLRPEMQYTREEIEDVPNPHRENEREDTLSH